MEAERLDFPVRRDRLSPPPGSPQRDERRRDHRQAGPARPAPAQLVHPGHLRHQRGRAVRGPGLALQPAEEPEMIHSSRFLTRFSCFLFCLLFISLFQHSGSTGPRPPTPHPLFTATSL